MARSNSRWLLCLTLLAGGTLAAACGSGSGTGDGPFEIDNGFESDDPSGKSAASKSGGSSSGGSSADAGTATNGGAASDGSGGATRAVEEADILKLDGTRLYTLSRYGGLAVIDVTDPDHMKMLGRKRTEGIPFEMYVRDGRAHVMLNDFGRWTKAESGAPYGRWVQSSEIASFDVSDPQKITEVAHFDVPGRIADSRAVGDVLYLVTYEDGYCYQCQNLPGTVVTSFNLTGAAVTKSDQIEYRASSANYSSWQRSVSATDQRLYIAGPEWSWQPGQQNASSVIQVVDISDPNGKLRKGANVPVSGQINSRWQMDEYAGFLRVVSQYGNGWGGGAGNVNPRVQTFSIQSSQSFTKVGETDIRLPTPESLRSVRFDGDRAYAITAQRKDPLFTIDLKDAAHPKQVGELAMPGWVYYMEPRGDRLVAFGYDDPVAGSTPLAVSLFDVTDLAKPAMLKRVTFGAGWSQLAEDQDRIQKSVRVLDDQGMILVPFASYGRFMNGSCEKAQSGIQLIDYGHDSLALRGVAPQYGLPRRALVTGGRLVAVSDRNVTSFDIGSRDAPVKKGELDLSNPTYRMVELPNHIASISNDWWTSEVLLSVTPKANADDADVSGKVSLASLAEADASLCNGSGWTSWYEARLFTRGNYVYVIVPRYSYGPSSRGGSVVLASIDVSNPASPQIVGKAEMKLTEHTTSGYYGGYYGNAFWDGWGFYSYYGGYQSSLVASGQGAVQLGSKLAYLEVDYEPNPVALPDGHMRYESTIRRKLHVADFANPTAPVVSAPVDLGDSLGTSPLHLWNGSVLTSRWIPSNRNPDKVRFFMDRVDLTGATPVRLPSINTPGSLLLADEPSQRIVTVDYHATRAPAADWQACQTVAGYRGRFDSDSKECVSVSRDFKLADVAGSRIRLTDTLVPPSQNIAGVEIAEDRVYVTRYKRYDYSTMTYGPGAYQEPKVIEDGGLWAIGGIRAGKLAIVSQMIGDANWPLAASGTKVALYTEGGLAIYDTATPTPTLVKEANLRGYGYSSHVLLGRDRAICSLGEWGMQTVSF